MTTHNFSIEDLAMALIVRLDRKNIFPPVLNDPEAFLTPADTTNMSFRRPKRSPNAFLVCRRNVHEEATRRGTYNMRVISKVTGILWKNASAEEKDVYKKLADRIYEIHYRRTSSLYRRMTATTMKERPTYKPYYSFPVQLPPPTSQNVSNASIVTPPDSPSPSVSPYSLSPVPVASVPPVPTFSTNTATFNFGLDGNDYFINNQANVNNNHVDMNTYTDFNVNNNQVIPHPNHNQHPNSPNYQSTENNQLIYLYNNVLVTAAQRF
jgi:hypothetical protein